MFQLVDSSRSDWWLVSVLESGQSGWVPADYLEKRVLDVGRTSSPPPEPFQDETGEIERVMRRYMFMSRFIPFLWYMYIHVDAIQ